MSSYCLHFAFLGKTGEDGLSYFSSFGQEGVVKQILYDVGGGGIKNLPLEKYPVLPSSIHNECSPKCELGLYAVPINTLYK